MVFRVPHLPVMGKNIETGYTDVVRLEYPRFIAKVPPAANMAATLCLCLAEAAPLCLCPAEGVGRLGLLFQNIKTLAIAA